MATVLVIKKHDPDSYNSHSTFMAVASSGAAALKWIEEETKKKMYAKGYGPDWWIRYGIFSLTEVEVYDV